MLGPYSISRKRGQRDLSQLKKEKRRARHCNWIVGLEEQTFNALFHYFIFFSLRTERAPLVIKKKLQRYSLLSGHYTYFQLLIGLTPQSCKERRKSEMKKEKEKNCSMKTRAGPPPTAMQQKSELEKRYGNSRSLLFQIVFTLSSFLVHSLDNCPYLCDWSETRFNFLRIVELTLQRRGLSMDWKEVAEGGLIAYEIPGLLVLSTFPSRLLPSSCRV